MILYLLNQLSTLPAAYNKRLSFRIETTTCVISEPRRQASDALKNPYTTLKIQNS